MRTERPSFSFSLSAARVLPPVPGRVPGKGVHLCGVGQRPFPRLASILTRLIPAYLLPLASREQSIAGGARTDMSCGLRPGTPRSCIYGCSTSYCKMRLSPSSSHMPHLTWTTSFVSWFFMVLYIAPISDPRGGRPTELQTIGEPSTRQLGMTSGHVLKASSHTAAILFAVQPPEVLYER